jgi:hypothetical protein
MHPEFSRASCNVIAGMSMLAIALLCTDATAARYTEGTAFARKSGQALYREAHYVYATEAGTAHLVIYRCPDGKAFARKRLRRWPDSVTPDFDFVDARSGYREGASVQAGLVRVYVQRSSDATLQSKSIALKPGAVIDAGFDVYLREHWDGLARDAVQLPFLIPSRLTFFGVKLDRDTEKDKASPAQAHLRMRLDAWFGAFVAPMELTYSPDGKRLRRFEGLGNIRNADGKNVDVRIEFPQEHDREIAQSDVDAAIAEPLAGRCTM